MPYTAYSLADLRGRLVTRTDFTPFYTASEIDAAINEALLTLGMLTGRWKRRVVLQTTAATYEVPLPSTMVYRMRVTFNGYPLSPTTLFDLDHGRPRWRTESTTSGGDVPTRPTLWAPVSLTLIYLWPMDAAGHNGLALDGVSGTPVLTADAQKVDLAEADLSPLLGFALHVLTFKKGGPVFAATLPLFRAFIAAAAQENSLITTSQVYRQVMGWADPALAPLIGAPTPVGSLVQTSQSS